MGIFDNVKAVIFDCDGVLVDSESMSCGALNVVFEDQFGIDIGENYEPVLGTSLAYSLKYYLDKFNITYDNISKLAEMKEQTYFTMAKKSLTSFPFCEEFINLLRSHDILIAVASSGSLEKIEFSLSHVNFQSYFEIITSSSEVKRGKPYPDLFLRTAEKLKVTSHECVVVEDSLSGIQAAIRANMRVIGFPGSFPNDALLKEGAFLASEGYRGLIELFQTHST
ncbi:MAG: HAD family hydrolase [Candidatus Kariarchaeaceae archaeon]